MRTEEATYIGALLKQLEGDSISPVVNLGSSTRAFREIVKPHIDARIFRPLHKRGVTVIHSDLKKDQGVDVAGDIFGEETLQKLRLLQPRLVLCCNMFEHVENRSGLVRAIDEMLLPGGYLMMTVPFSYPLHLDPIDTYYRPSPDELCQLFPAYEFVEGGIIASTSYLQDVFSLSNLRRELPKLMKRLVTFFYPFFRPAEWIRRHHRLFWMFRHYKVTVVLLKKAD